MPEGLFLTSDSPTCASSSFIGLIAATTDGCVARGALDAMITESEAARTTASTVVDSGSASVLVPAYN